MTNNSADALRSTKSLFDPLKTVTILSVVFALINLVLGAVLLAGGDYSQGLAALSSASFGFALAVLVAPGRQTNAFYLRSFRTDKMTASLRTNLAGILGPDFRLSGIRPPRERANPFVRFCLPGFFALRYAGSKFMNLEAGEDWLARLWKSYQKSRIVFIDVRDITAYVHQEILMTVDSMGPERCIFLINDERTMAEWRQHLGEILCGEFDPEKLNLLNVDARSQTIAQIETQLKSLLSILPPGEAGVRQEGQQFVLEHVSEEILKQSQKVAPAAVVLALAGIVVMVGSLLLVKLMVSLIGPAAIIPLIPLDIVMLVLLANAYYNLLGRALNFRRFGNPSGRAWGALFVVSLFMMGAMAFQSVAALIPITAGIRLANATTRVAQAHAIGLALFSYENDNNGAMPKGKSSTEVFQKLIDDGYVTDPSLFYFAMTGKVAPTSKMLEAQNVCFDVTAGLKSDSPNGVPEVYTTGFTASYTGGGNAVPSSSTHSDGMAIYYTSNNANFIKADPDGSVPGFMPPFTDGTATGLWQLTPEGSLGTPVTPPVGTSTTDQATPAAPAAGSAQFNTPMGLALDGAGNLYVVDQGNNCIRKIAPTGAVTTLAGQAGTAGSTDGAGGAAQFNSPIGAAVDARGNVFVADTGNDTIRKITPEGAVSTVAGSAGVAGSTDGPAAAARFNSPSGVAVDAGGNLFVADKGNDTIRKITVDGTVSTVAGMPGKTQGKDGAGSAATFDQPYDLVVDKIGTIYVSDSVDDTVRKITPAGEVTTLAGSAGQTGYHDATGSDARFTMLKQIAFDAGGNLYVAESLNYTVRQITPAGVVATLAHMPDQSANGTGTNSDPAGLAIDDKGDVFVTEPDNNTIQKIGPDGTIVTYAGSAGQAGSNDGPSLPPATSK